MKSWNKRRTNKLSYTPIDHTILTTNQSFDQFSITWKRPNVSNRSDGHTTVVSVYTHDFSNQGSDRTDFELRSETLAVDWLLISDFSRLLQLSVLIQNKAKLYSTMWNGVSTYTDPDEKRWRVLHLWREERALWDITDPDYNSHCVCSFFRVSFWFSKTI